MELHSKSGEVRYDKTLHYSHSDFQQYQPATKPTLYDAISGLLCIHRNCFICFVESRYIALLCYSNVHCACLSSTFLSFTKIPYMNKQQMSLINCIRMPFEMLSRHTILWSMHIPIAFFKYYNFCTHPEQDVACHPSGMHTEGL
jgi:hypothetical protein